MKERVYVGGAADEICDRFAKLHEEDEEKIELLYGTSTEFLLDYKEEARKNLPNTAERILIEKYLQILPLQEFIRRKWKESNVFENPLKVKNAFEKAIKESPF